MIKEQAQKLALTIQSALKADVMEFINDDFTQLDENGQEQIVEEESFYLSKSNYDHEDLLVLNKLLRDEGFEHNTEQNELLRNFGIDDNTKWFVRKDMDVSYDTEERDLYLVISWKSTH